MHIWVSFGDMQKNLNGKYFRTLSFFFLWLSLLPLLLPLLFHSVKSEMKSSSSFEIRKRKETRAKKPQEFREHSMCWMATNGIHTVFSVLSTLCVIQFRWNRMNFETGIKLCSILHPPSTIHHPPYAEFYIPLFYFIKLELLHSYSKFGIYVYI